jgi:hypothetical protein
LNGRGLRSFALLAAAAACGVSLAGCGGASESAGTFVTRILREEIQGEWAAQWTELHPGQQRLISKAQYVRCSERLGTNVGTGHETYSIQSVHSQKIDVEGVPERTAKLVTIRVKGGGIASTFHLHAVLHDGHWRWILAPEFLAAISHGRCLDGSRLSGSAPQSRS